MPKPYLGVKPWGILIPLCHWGTGEKGILVFIMALCVNDIGRQKWLLAVMRTWRRTVWLIKRWRYNMEMLYTLLTICEGNHWSPVDSPHKGPVMLKWSWSICWINHGINDSLRGLDVYAMIAIWVSHGFVCSFYPCSSGILTWYWGQS